MMSETLPCDLVGDILDDPARLALEEMAAAAREHGSAWLEVHFASLPRRFGRTRLSPRRVSGRSADFDLGRLRHADVAASALLEAATAPGELIETLYRQGDAEERRMLLVSMPLLERRDVFAELLREAHRTNDLVLFTAAVADTDLPARLLDDDDLARVVLRAAFVDVDVDRLWGVPRRMTCELAEMLLDFMSEREAAHRPAWPGSLVLAAHAPTPSVVAKVMGDLCSGVDARRLAAARAAGLLRDRVPSDLIEERLENEKVERIRAVLEAL